LARQQASTDFGIRVTAPFFLDAPDGGKLDCATHLPDFGGTAGTVLISMEDSDEADRLADALGYCCSCLNMALSNVSEPVVSSIMTVDSLYTYSSTSLSGLRPAFSAFTALSVPSSTFSPRAMMQTESQSRSALSS